ncbi:MAG: carboxypeptidase regulatory-like domain-containing protein, partial [Anaerolineae bacterium]|nr:carboxypeptidase regulatory-like domain-containing protein [Anaerolineae bacterium]
TVDGDGWAGAYTALALDGADHPHISYYDPSNDDLKYAHWTGSTWDIQTVDSAGDMGRYTSLALDASGYPHISYFDDSSYNLRY